MKCNKCGVNLEEGAKFCPQCGEKVVVRKVCQGCGTELKEGERFCPVCGKATLLSEEKASEKAEQIAAAVIEKNGTKNDLQSESDKRKETRTPEGFLLELEELKAKDKFSKQVLEYYGTKIFVKYIYPCLGANEKIVNIRHIVHFNVITFIVRDGALLTKEFLVLTDRRIIKFAKTVCMKPWIISCPLSQITNIKTSAPKNWLFANFIGEKMYVKSNTRTIKIRTMGKGSSRRVSSEIYDIKSKGKPMADEFSNKSIRTDEVRNSEKKRPWKFVGIAAVVVMVAIAAFCVLGSGHGSGGTELYDILPLAKADVEKYMSRNGIKDEDDIGMYSKDGITIMLNEKGNIDLIVLDTPGYSLCNVEVGSKFEYEKDYRKFTDHGYSFITEDEETGMIAFGLPDGKEGLGGDQVIWIQNDSNNVVQNIMFQRTGAKELVAEIENAFDFIDPDDNIGYLPEDKEDENSDYHEEMEDAEKWIGTYESDDGQSIEIFSADNNGFILTFNGYGEEGWYKETNELHFENGDLSKVSLPYYNNGQLIEETVYTLTKDGILVETLPAGGWTDGMYKRIEDRTGGDVKNEIISGYYTEPNNETRLSISIYSDLEDLYIGEIEYDYGFGYDHYMILDSESSIYQLIDSMGNSCGSLEVLDDKYIVLEIFGDETTYHCEEEYIS